MQPFIQASYRMWNPSLIQGICPIRSAGHYIVQPGFRESPMRKDFFELFWTAKGCGYFQLENEVVSLGEGEVFCYFPGDYHVVFSGENHWEYYWLTLSGKDLPLLLKKFAFSREPRKIGSCPVKLFNDLISQLTGVDFGHAILATSTCYALLNQAANPVPEDADNLVMRFKRLVTQGYCHLDFSVAQCAAQLGVHRSTLHRIFSSCCGISPQKYLTSFRTQQAMNLLLDGHSVKELVELCGFLNTNYFTKVFRKQYGKPPVEFRNRRT